MLDVAVQTFSCLPLIPIFDNRDAMQLDVNLPPNLSIPKGTPLGPITSTAVAAENGWPAGTVMDPACPPAAGTGTPSAGRRPRAR